MHSSSGIHCFADFFSSSESIIMFTLFPYMLITQIYANCACTGKPKPLSVLDGNAVLILTSTQNEFTTRTCFSKQLPTSTNKALQYKQNIQNSHILISVKNKDFASFQESLGLGHSRHSTESQMHIPAEAPMDSASSFKLRCWVLHSGYGSGNRIVVHKLYKIGK